MSYLEFDPLNARSNSFIKLNEPSSKIILKLLCLFSVTGI